MALAIYGSPRSRTMRALWMAAELGLEYEHVRLGFDDPALKAPAFLKLNPAGAIPTIVDDAFALSDSLAINLYLAKKFGARGPEALYPATPEGEADAWRWTLWAQSQLEPWVRQDARLAPFARVSDWLQRCYARPAAVAARQRFDAFVDPARAGRPQ